MGTILLVFPLASHALSEEKNFEGLSLSIGGNAISTKQMAGLKIPMLL